MSALSHGTPIYLTEDIRRIETLAHARVPTPSLMERAGLAAAELAQVLATSGKRIAVLAGPGNNGGDAFVVARHLKSTWFNVDVLFTGSEAKLSEDAAAALKAWRDAGGTLASELPRAGDCGLIVDGLFGIGLQRDLTGRYAELVQWMAAARCPVLALDVPSGLESDSGRVLGCAVRATHTITFIGMKPGLLTLDAVDHCGELHLATLDLDAPALVAPHGHLIDRDVLRALPARRLNSHKGDYGSVGIVGGASGMVGAALLAGRAALKLGAGRVYVGFEAADAPGVDLVQPELMLRRAESIFELDHLTCLAVGPGLGQSAGAEKLLSSALSSDLPLVLDADALNLIARGGGLRDALLARNAPALLTPHPAEAARLLGVSTADVQRDRVEAALQIAGTLRSAIVLKGAGSVCAWPGGRWAINTSGNAGMASAGMGDVLTGFLAALIAQRVPPDAALECGVHLHGAAADLLVHDGVGPTGLTAGEVIDAARRLINVRP
ncbi:MAG TPA: NAD(P)H-hydrate dehydratase [Burkholderiales bacterium]|nr:NAD(P)H-hydrate dehydratase [Burkholderiales bacterium]